MRVSEKLRERDRDKEGERECVCVCARKREGERELRNVNIVNTISFANHAIINVDNVKVLEIDVNVHVDVVRSINV